MKRKKILLTGCSGLVGTFLLTELLKSGFDYEIVGVDLKEPIIKYNTHYQSRFLFLNLDLTKDDVVTKLFNKYNFDYVINCFGIKGSPVKAK